MDESRGWTVNGAEWRERVATVSEQRRVPIVDCRTVRVSSGDYPRIRSSRVRTRRVHPDVLRRQMEERKGQRDG